MFLHPFAKPLALDIAAPAFARIDQNSRTVYSERLLESGGYIAHFYRAPSHRSSREELLYLKDIAPQLASRNVQIVAFNPADWEAQHQLAQELSLPYSLLFDPLSQTASAFGATQLKMFFNHPLTFGIGAQGTVDFVLKSGAIRDILKFYQ